jgi:hypothetical protein
MADSIKYPGNIEDLAQKGAGMVMFTFYERPNSIISNEISSVLLYMPQTLETPLKASWEQAAGLLQYGADVYRRHGKDRGMAIWEEGGGLAGMAARVARLALPSDEDIVAQASGTIANPYISMTFKGIEFREFDMMFKFTPHNPEDSEIIMEIIRKFRGAALPAIIEEANISFPMEIEIEYKGNASQWLTRYKRCVLTDVHVNYTSAGFYAAMLNGFPAETELRLHFTENELVDRADVAKRNGENGGY